MVTLWASWGVGCQNGHVIFNKTSCTFSLEWERNLWSWCIDYGVSLAPDTQHAMRSKPSPWRRPLCVWTWRLARLLQPCQGLVWWWVAENRVSSSCTWSSHSEYLFLQDNVCWATTEFLLYLTTLTRRGSQKRFILYKNNNSIMPWSKFAY